MVTLIPGANVPAITPTDRNTAVRPLVWGIGPQYSYERNDFMFDNSNDIIVSNEAVQLSQWITNALITPRLRHYIHGRNFGSDFDLVQAKNYPKNVVKNMAEGYVKQALSVDPRIKSVVSVDAVVYLKSLVIAVIIVTATGYRQQFEIQWSVP